MRSVSEASQGVQQVAQIIIEVQRGAGETGTSADLVLNSAREVASLSETLQNAVVNFLETIRSDKPQDSVEVAAEDRGEDVEPPMEEAAE